VTLQQGPDLVMFARLALRPASPPALSAAVAASKRRLREVVPEVAWTFVELGLA
jgi:hypothetical protein